MKMYGLNTLVLASLTLLGAEMLRAQPTANPLLFNFTYQVGSTTLPAPGKLTATLSKSTASGYTLTASTANVSLPDGWLTVTPRGGASPLALTVTVNPTGLSPGSYTGFVALGTNPATSTTLVPVTLSISNAPSSITVTPAGCPSSCPTNYSPGFSGSNPMLAFNYTTGDSGALPSSTELDVASNGGGTIPFTVAAVSGSKTANWLKVNGTVQTSSVTLSGNYVPIVVSIDSNALVSLDVGPYAGTITFTNIANGAAVVVAVISVSLNVSAGLPTIASIFPGSVTAAASSGRVPPLITIYGDNFFNNSSVQLQQDGAQPLPAFKPVLLSRQVLQVTLNPINLITPATFTLTVANPSTLSNPKPQTASVTFTVTDGTVPQISGILNAASYQKSATWKGTPGLDPVLPGSSAVSPREIIAIFGQSLGPAAVSPAQASTTFPPTFPTQVTFPAVLATPPTTSGGTTYKVMFTFCDGTSTSPPTVPCVGTNALAPIIMVSSNQINAVVPVPLSVPPLLIPPAALLPNAWVQVVVTTDGASAPVTTDWFPVTFVPEVPGIFTFGGLGLGQAAVLNYDAITGYTINSSKNPAPRGSTISLYATGMGDLVDGVTITVTDSSTPKQQVPPPNGPPQNFGLIINPPPLPTGILTASSAVIGLVQNSFSITPLQAVGGTPPYAWSVTSGLPKGMTLSSSGLLSGTPTTTFGSPFSLQVSVTDSTANPLVATAAYTVAIGLPIITVTTSQLVPGVMGIAYPAATLTVTGGRPPYTWVATGLPAAGLTLTAGVLSGRPTTNVGSPFPLTFTATDSAGVASTVATVYLDVLSSGMTITTQSLPNGVVGVPYVSTTLQQQGGTGIINWICSGSCAGLSLNPTTGLLSGTPDAPAVTISITATDSTNPTPLTAAFNYNVNVSAPAATLSITTASPLPSGSQFISYPAFAMQAAGGTPPYTWTATGLPLGMTMSSSGILTGVPTAQFYLRMLDGVVALGAVYVVNSTYRVEINGQAAVTSYAGSSGGSVAGLTQINAIVPPTAPTGAAIPLVVYIGKSNGARASQLGVTLAVK